MEHENESDHSDKTSQENQITGLSANLRHHTKEPTKKFGKAMARCYLTSVSGILLCYQMCNFDSQLIKKTPHII